MDKGNGIQEERLEIQNVLKAMNWEARLEEARARRKEVLAQRQPDDDKAEALKARLSAANSSRNVALETVESVQESIEESVQEVALAGGGKPRPAPVVVFPVRQLSVEEPAFAFEAAVAQTKLPPASQPVADVTPESNVKGRLALGLGIGLGIGLSMLVGVILIGSRPGVSVADAPTVTAEATLTVAEPATTQEAPVVAEAPAVATVSEAAESTSQVTETSFTTTAPVVSDNDPIPLSQVTFVAAQIEVPELAASVASPSRQIAFLVAPNAQDGGPEISASSPRPDFEIQGSEIGSALTTDKPAVAHVSQPDTLQDELRTPAHLKLLSTPEQDLQLAMAAISPPETPSFLSEGVQDLPEGSVLAQPESVLRPVSRPVASRVALPSELFEILPDTPVDGVVNPQNPDSITDPRLPGAEGYIVRVSVPVTVPDEKVEQLVAKVRETGVSLRPVSRVNFKVSKNQVRFFFAEDATSAKAIAERVGAEARDFTSFRPSPPTGTIEVFLAGDGKRVAPRKKRKSRFQSDVDRLRDRVIKSLRSGDYL